MLSCRRLITAIDSGDEYRAEAARADTMKKMAMLIEEFGLTEVAFEVIQAVCEFDGQHIESEEPALVVHKRVKSFSDKLTNLKPFKL